MHTGDIFVLKLLHTCQILEWPIQGGYLGMILIALATISKNQQQSVDSGMCHTGL